MVSAGNIVRSARDRRHTDHRKAVNECNATDRPLATGCIQIRYDNVHYCRGLFGKGALPPRGHKPSLVLDVYMSSHDSRGLAKVLASARATKGINQKKMQQGQKNKAISCWNMDEQPYLEHSLQGISVIKIVLAFHQLA